MILTQTFQDTLKGIVPDAEIDALTEVFLLKLLDLHPVELGHLVVEIQAIRELRQNVNHPEYRSALTACFDHDPRMPYLKFDKSKVKSYMAEIEAQKGYLRHVMNRHGVSYNGNEHQR